MRVHTTRGAWFEAMPPDEDTKWRAIFQSKNNNDDDEK